MATDYADILLVDGDIDISSGDVSIIEDNLVSLKQRLDLRFAIWQAEWKYNESYGTPYRDYIGLAPNKATLDQEIKRQILKEQDVVEVSSVVSMINKTLRLYTFIATVSTNEATLSYSLNLRDSFEYQIPSYSIGCDKIVEYQYWSSAPYDYLHLDSVNLSSTPLISSLLDPIKDIESVSLSTAVMEGYLKDAINVDAPLESYTTTAFSLNTGIINSAYDGYLRLGESYTTSGYNLTAGTIITYRTVTTNEDESYTTSGYSLVSGIITTT